MQLIVRRLKKKGASREVSQEAISGDLISIGRGSDQSIQIADKRIPLSHSQLIYRNGSLFVQTNSGNSVLVNNEAVRSSQLLADDVLEIAGYEIKLIEGDDGADFILEINLDAQEVQPLQIAPLYQLFYIIYCLSLSIQTIPSFSTYIYKIRLNR